MPRKDSKSTSASKRKESPTKEDLEDSKRAKTEDGKNLGNVVGGYKAALHNPNVSEEAKEHAEEMIEKLEGDAPRKSDNGSENLEGKDLGHVIGGYKATLSNPNVSEEAKEHAEKMLEKLDGGDVSERRSDSDSLEGKDLGHVIAGYKAALANEHVSKEAKEHAHKMLEHLLPHHTEGKDLGHVIGGFKAALSNPNTSDEAREHAKKMIEELGRHLSKPQRDERLNKHGKDLGHIVGGYKSTLSKTDSSSEARDHATKMLGHLEQHHTEGRHLGHVIGGYKATLSNPNVSDEAKEHARQMLEELGADDYEYSTKDDSEKNPNNVLGGYKATLSNPNVSEEAKEHAREVLEESGVSSTSSLTGRSAHTKEDHEKNPGNVIGGLKAALKNPNVSEEAKDDIRSNLDEAKVAY